MGYPKTPPGVFCANAGPRAMANPPQCLRNGPVKLQTVRRLICIGGANIGADGRGLHVGLWRVSVLA